MSKNREVSFLLHFSIGLSFTELQNWENSFSCVPRILILVQNILQNFSISSFYLNWALSQMLEPPVLRRLSRYFELKLVNSISDLN